MSNTGTDMDQVMQLVDPANFVFERRKEPREGSEIEPEIVCIQAVGADLFRDCVPCV